MVVLFPKHRGSPESSDDEEEEEEVDLERSGFEDEEVETAQVHSARWSQSQPPALNFLSLNDAESPTQSTELPETLALANHLPHEILIHIFRLITHPRDLYSVLLVSRAWCQCSVELLWHKPQFTKLASIFKLINMVGRKDHIFQYSTFIRRLNFTILSTDLTDPLFSRLTACVRLERLTLFGCSAVSDIALENVLKACPNLVALDLTGVTETTDLSITTLAATAPRLQGINLGNCKKVTDVGIIALALSCPNLRRIKLSGLELLSDAPVSALAKNCPLLLELDLHNCPRVTDDSIRDLWLHSTYLRELRLSLVSNLTENAFPAPPPSSTSTAVQNAFPNSTPQADVSETLLLSRAFDHIRMLDLTGCVNLTDDAMEGIIANCPKIRNLVLAKCSGLTDEAVGSICKLGRHLHYLHLGHVSNITDRAVTRLARACTRLRYIDLACCPLLTDMSVFEIANLPKLRRIGLVRVPHLTDQAVYSLGDRHTSLERIHLSYCENISVSAIHYLLQRLHKLTHLSLTGIPAFRRPELQQFCRSPPKEFTQNQRAAFCVYSGRGVNDLRRYLQLLSQSQTDTSADLEDSGSEVDDQSGGGINGYDVRPPGDSGSDKGDETGVLPSMPGAMPTTAPISTSDSRLAARRRTTPRANTQIASEGSGLMMHNNDPIHHAPPTVTDPITAQAQAFQHQPPPHPYPFMPILNGGGSVRQDVPTFQMAYPMGFMPPPPVPHTYDPSRPTSLNQLPTYHLGAFVGTPTPGGTNTYPTFSYTSTGSASTLPFPLTRSSVAPRPVPGRRTSGGGIQHPTSGVPLSSEGTTPGVQSQLTTHSGGTSTLIYPARHSVPSSQPTNHHQAGSPGIPSHDQVISTGSSPPGQTQEQGTSWKRAYRLNTSIGNTGTSNPSSPVAFPTTATTSRAWTLPWNTGVASPAPSPSGSAAAFALGSNSNIGEPSSSMMGSTESSPPSSGLTSARRTPTGGGGGDAAFRAAEESVMIAEARRELRVLEQSLQGALGGSSRGREPAPDNAGRSRGGGGGGVMRTAEQYASSLFRGRSGSGSRQRTGSPQGGSST